jgi:hypothetical protein
LLFLLGQRDKRLGKQQQVSQTVMISESLRHWNFFLFLGIHSEFRENARLCAIV